MSDCLGSLLGPLTSPFSLSRTPHLRRPRILFHPMSHNNHSSRPNSKHNSISTVPVRVPLLRHPVILQTILLPLPLLLLLPPLLHVTMAVAQPTRRRGLRIPSSSNHKLPHFLPLTLLPPPQPPSPSLHPCTPLDHPPIPSRAIGLRLRILKDAWLTPGCHILCSNPPKVNNLPTNPMRRPH